MIDIQSFNQSLKMKWVKGYSDDDNQAKWKSFFNYYLERHGGNVPPVNLRSIPDRDCRILEYFKLQGREPRLFFHPDLA